MVVSKLSCSPSTMRHELSTGRELSPGFASAEGRDMAARTDRAVGRFASREEGLVCASNRGRRQGVAMLASGGPIACRSSAALHPRKSCSNIGTQDSGLRREAYRPSGRSCVERSTLYLADNQLGDENGTSARVC